MESRGQGTHSRQHGEEHPLEPQLWPHLIGRPPQLIKKTCCLGGQRKPMANLENAPAEKPARGGMVSWDAVCLALCVHATRVHLASGQFPARGGLPTSSYPTNFNMGQAPPQASLSSYDQEILSKGPPGIGAGAASDTPPMNPQVSPT